MALIEVEHARKVFTKYGRRGGRWGTLRTLLAREKHTVVAVDDVSFRVNEGEMVGYIGPNGAGKSTTMKMLTGILVPSSGRVVVDGRVPYRQRVEHVRHIGVVFGQRTQLWWDLPTRESFELLRHIYRVPEARCRDNLAYFTELLELGPFLETPVRQLSLGQRMRADLAAALLHEPRILFLDEPTIGLDVVAKERIRQFLTDINRERGVTVILTTHDLDDIERLCPRVVLIDHGRVIYDGALEALRTRFGRQRTLVVDFSSGSRARRRTARRGGAARRPARVAALRPRCDHRGSADRRRGRALPRARPDRRGAGDRGDRARYLPAGARCGLNPARCNRRSNATELQ